MSIPIGYSAADDESGFSQFADYASLFLGAGRLPQSLNVAWALRQLVSRQALQNGGCWFVPARELSRMNRK